MPKEGTPAPGRLSANPNVERAPWRTTIVSDANENKENAAAGTAAAPAKKKKSLLKKLAAPVVVAVAGVGAAQFLLPPREGAGAPDTTHGAPAAEAAPHGQPEPAKVEAPKSGSTKHITYLLTNVLVNLANTSAKRYLKVSLALDCEVPLKGSEDEMRARIDQLKSQFQDRVIEMLSAKTVESLEGRESKVVLKGEILAELDPILFAATEGHIVKLYYQEFVIQ
jgi:flagellar basal body-associated protein FliL